MGRLSVSPRGRFKKHFQTAITMSVYQQGHLWSQFLNYTKNLEGFVCVCFTSTHIHTGDELKKDREREGGACQVEITVQLNIVISTSVDTTLNVCESVFEGWFDLSVT